MLIKLVCWLLKRKKLTTAHRQLLTNQILSSIDGLPLHAIITVNEGKIFIRGVPLDGEREMSLRHSADLALNNPALRVVHEQVLYQAITHGVHVGSTPEQIQFSKAAIWYGQQEVDLLKKLSTGDATELLG